MKQLREGGKSIFLQTIHRRIIATVYRVSLIKNSKWENLINSLMNKWANKQRVLERKILVINIQHFYSPEKHKLKLL